MVCFLIDSLLFADFRVWDARTGEMLNTLIHHCEAVLHLRFCDGIMVTCSKVSDSCQIVSYSCVQYSPFMFKPHRCH